MNLTTLPCNPSQPGFHSISVWRPKAYSTSQVVPERPVPFAMTLAHEIRNPLNNINLAMEMLQSMTNDDTQKTYLDIVLRGSARIGNIVSDFLNPATAVEAVQEIHSIHEMLDEVLDMAGDRILLKNIRVKKNYATQYPPALFKKPEIKIALTNIIVNAIEAMPAKGGVLKISTKKMSGACAISISDNGTGISKENLKTIFKPYFTNKPGGLGLGLSATLDILYSNHVWVNVRSAEGKGTQFTLLFEKKMQ